MIPAWFAHNTAAASAILLAASVRGQDAPPALPDTNSLAFKTETIRSNLPAAVKAIISSNLANLPTNAQPAYRVIGFNSTTYPTALLAKANWNDGWHLLATFAPASNQITWTDYSALPQRFYTVAILPTAPQLIIQTNKQP